MCSHGQPSPKFVGPLKISYWLLLDARGAYGKAKADGKADGKADNKADFKADYTDGKVDGNNNADGMPTERSNPAN